MNKFEFEHGFNTLKQGKEFEKHFKGFENPPESHIVWAKIGSTDSDFPETWKLITKDDYESWLIWENPDSPFVPAFSCAELGVLLPIFIMNDVEKHFLFTQRRSKGWLAGYCRIDDESTLDLLRLCKAEHEAHAKAELGLNLLDDGIIKPEGLTF